MTVHFFNEQFCSVEIMHKEVSSADIHLRKLIHTVSDRDRQGIRHVAVMVERYGLPIYLYRLTRLWGNPGAMFTLAKTPPIIRALSSEDNSSTIASDKSVFISLAEIFNLFSIFAYLISNLSEQSEQIGITLTCQRYRWSLSRLNWSFNVNLSLMPNYVGNKDLAKVFNLCSRPDNLIRTKVANRYISTKVCFSNNQTYC